jgi:outer membrane protein insertion porin family
MKRVLREVVVGAVSCVATVSVGAMASPAEALIQDLRPTSVPEDAAPAAPAQAAPGAGQQAAPPIAPQAAPVIRRVLVEGNQRIEASTIASYLLLRSGDTFDAERIDLSLKTLFATGLFADVDIEQRGADLVVSVVENPIVNRVLFEGVNALDEEDLQDEIQADPRSVFTAARVQADVQRIIELYRRAGRFAATVSPQVRELEQNRVDLIFEIDEGPVTGVRSINFIGNEAFSDRRLRDSIVTTESSWWNFFSRNDNYDPDRLEYDREQLRQYYTNRGYADFRVVSAVAEMTPDQKDFYITFTVDEGVQYDFGEITVTTALDRVPAEMLRAAIPIREGELFEADLIEDSIDAMNFVAGSVGYANVDIRPRVDRDTENRVVNITFEVNEGPRVFIERINIVNNTQTRDEVIRREMRTVEGDAFNRVLLDRSRSRVRALGFFQDVTLEERPGTTRDRAIVDVTVEEDTTGEVSFAAGFSTTDSILFDISLTQRNLAGRGQYLRFRAASSSRSQQLELRFLEPRFLGRELSAGFDIYSLRSDFSDESSFENQSTGFGLRTYFPLTERTSLSANYTFVQDDLDVVDSGVAIDDPANPGSTIVVDQCSPLNPNRALICFQEGSFLTSLVGYNFVWDRRNDVIDPTRGFDFSFRQDFAGIGGDVQYLRSEIESSIYYGILPDMVASFTMSSGYILGWGEDEVRINDRFFKGGQSFRGFEVAGLGPRQLIRVTDASGNVVNTIEGDALGGNLYAIGTFQLTVPTGLPESFGLGAALFAEFGTVGQLDDGSRASTSVTSGSGSTAQTFTQFVEDEATLRASAGVSVFWDSPFGPVQFDFSQPFQREDYDQTETFRFSTRRQF